MTCSRQQKMTARVVVAWLPVEVWKINASVSAHVPAEKTTSLKYGTVVPTSSAPIGLTLCRFSLIYFLTFFSFLLSVVSGCWLAEKVGLTSLHIKPKQSLFMKKLGPVGCNRTATIECINNQNQPLSSHIWCVGWFSQSSSFLYLLKLNRKAKET